MVPSRATGAYPILLVQTEPATNTRIWRFYGDWASTGGMVWNLDAGNNIRNLDNPRVPIP